MLGPGIGIALQAVMDMHRQQLARAGAAHLAQRAQRVQQDRGVAPAAEADHQWPGAGAAARTREGVVVQFRGGVVGRSGKRGAHGVGQAADGIAAGLSFPARFP